MDRPNLLDNLQPKLKILSVMAGVSLLSGCVHHVSSSPVPPRETHREVRVSARDLSAPERIPGSSIGNALQDAVSDQLGLVLYAVKHRVETGQVPRDTDEFVAYLERHGVVREDLVKAEFTEEDAGSFAYRLTIQHATGQTATEGRFTLNELEMTPP